MKRYHVIASNRKYRITCSDVLARNSIEAIENAFDVKPQKTFFGKVIIVAGDKYRVSVSEEK